MDSVFHVRDNYQPLPRSEPVAMENVVKDHAEPRLPAYEDNPRCMYSYGRPVPPPPPPTQVPAYTPPSPYGGASAPYSLQPTQMQQQSSNVVVVNQAAGGRENIVQVVHANNFSTLTKVLFVIFCLTGQWTALLCSFPALIFTCIADVYNTSDEYLLAKRFGTLACRLNVVAVVYATLSFVISAIIAIILLINIHSR